MILTKKDREKAKLISTALVAVMLSVMTIKANEFKEQHVVNETVVSRVSDNKEAAKG